MRGALVLLLCLAACATPPRVDDLSSPRGTYETFRGALAREEIEREYACLSENLCSRLGIRNRAEWRDLRTLVLRANHVVVKGIRRSSMKGEPVVSGEEAEAELSFPFGVSGRIRFLRRVVLRVYRQGDDHPVVDELLEGVAVVPGADRLALLLPPEVSARVLQTLGEKNTVSRVEVRPEWFLDDFEIAGTAPEDVARGRGREDAR